MPPSHTRSLKIKTAIRNGRPLMLDLFLVSITEMRTAGVYDFPLNDAFAVFLSAFLACASVGFMV